MLRYILGRLLLLVPTFIGITIIASLALAVVVYMVTRVDYAAYLYFPYIKQGGELAVVVLALVGAGPVYRLLGKKDVGATVLPALDAPLISGSLGFLYHTGKHTITEADWKAFFEFTGRHFE